MRYYPPRYLFRRYEIIKRLAPSSNFLEIGSGNLELSRELLKFYQTGVGFDISEHSLSYYEKWDTGLRRRYELFVTDFLDSCYHENFTCVVACEVMEHIEDDVGFLEKLHKALVKEGIVIVSVPARMKYWSKHDEIVGHIRRYEKNDLLNVLKKSRFRCIDIRSYGFPFVNLLRIPRVLLATLEYTRKREWDRKRQTTESGTEKIPLFSTIFGTFVNPITFYPLNLIASLFNEFDLSDGYLVTAKK